ncbi:MAG TPA: hypothetical protein DDX91_02565 [Ruminococcaceae bacterium]|nr:hypothetical protein [Oscillospiraceae bacterium]
MKKIFLILTTVFVCALSLAACSNAASTFNDDFTGLEFTDWGRPNRKVYNDLGELEKDSDLVVIGTFVKNAEQKETYLEEFDKKTLTAVFSTNYIEISKVIKGDAKAGDTVPVKQNYGVHENKYVTTSGLTPMIKGDSWLFFLKEERKEEEPAGTGIYMCVGDSDGRYPLENFSYKKIALTDNEKLGVFEEYDFRREIYKEIVDKYDLLSPANS